MSRVVKEQMGTSRVTGRARRFYPLLGLLGLGACTSVLGIEDLHQDARPGAGGEDSTAGTANTDAGKNAGGKNSGGGATGGSDNPSGGSTSPNAGTGNASTGGVSTAAGAANEAGGAGGAPANAGTVHGKVIDRWGMPVANATIQIGEQQVSSDAKGAFTVNDVPATYDVSMLVYSTIAWVYQGLTLREPTLQVYDGNNDHYTYVDVGFKAGTTLGTNDKLSVAIGTSTGSIEEADVGTDSTFSMQPEWQGATTTTATGHALFWTVNASTNLPVTYKAYDTKTEALADGVDGSPFTFDIGSTTPLTSKNVTGTVTPYGQGARNNSVFARFSSGARIQIVDHTPTMDPFTYAVPDKIANASYTVAAWEGSLYGPLGLIHKDGLNPGDAAGALKIPAPPTILTPPNDTKNVDATTSFSFKSSADNAGAFLVILNNLADPQKLYIVTTQKKFTLPKVVDGAFTLALDTDYEWWVETHGSFATVDAMAGPTGFVDEFSKEFIKPVGVQQESGTYTYSAAPQFTTKP